MKIKALTTFTDGYMSEGFIFGGTREPDKITSTKYPYFIISYLIDTGSEVVLVDTSYPDEISELPENTELGIYCGKRTKKFEEALNDVGYKLKDIDKIINNS